MKYKYARSYTIVQMFIEPPSPKNLFCKWRPVIHWSVFHYELDNNNGNTDMEIQNHIFSVKYQNKWTTFSYKRASSVRVDP